MFLTRWHTVHGCVEWLRLRVPRYIGPEVHGLPSLGPCTRAALAGAPALFIPAAVPVPLYAAPPLEVAPYAGEWLGSPGFFLPGEAVEAGPVAIPPSFVTAAGPLPEVEIAPPSALGLLPPGEQAPPPGAVPESGPGPFPVASPGPGAGPLAPPGAPPPTERVPEPPAAALLAGALGLAAVAHAIACGRGSAGVGAGGRGPTPQLGAGPLASPSTFSDAARSA